MLLALVGALAGCGGSAPTSNDGKGGGTTAKAVVEGLNRWVESIAPVAKQLGARERYVNATDAYLRRTTRPSRAVVGRRLAHTARLEHHIAAGAAPARTLLDGARDLVAGRQLDDKLRLEVIAAGDAYSRWTSRVSGQPTKSLGPYRHRNFGRDNTDTRTADLAVVASST